MLYLVETAEMESLPELIGYSYSYCRTRVLSSGDKMYFRPVFYVLLSVEKWLWGYNFVFWQLTGVFLHIINVLLLFGLLKMVLPKVTAFLLALFFSVLYVGADLVTWHHMHGYLLFIIFVLAAMFNYVRYIQSAQREQKKLWLMALFLFFACFTNEFGLILSVIIPVILMVHRKYVLNAPLLNWKKNTGGTSLFNNPLLLLFSPACYLYISLIDYALRFTGGNMARQSIGFSFSIDFVKFLYQYIVVFLASFILPFSPGIFMIFPEGKNYAVFWPDLNLKLLEPYNKIILASNGLLFAVILTALAIVVYGVIRGKKASTKALEMKRTREFQTPVFAMFLSLVALMGYIFVFVFFRTSQSSLAYLLRNLYHFYIMTLFVVIAAGCLWAVINILPNEKKKLFNKLMMIIICSGILLNGLKLYSLNKFGREIFTPWGSYIMRLESFVNAHKKENDFSFYSITRNDAMVQGFRMDTGSEEKEVRAYVSDFLFREYIDVDAPKYYVAYTREEGIIPLRSKEEADQYLKKRKSQASSERAGRHSANRSGRSNRDLSF